MLVGCFGNFLPKKSSNFLNPQPEMVIFLPLIKTLFDRPSRGSVADEAQSLSTRIKLGQQENSDDIYALSTRMLSRKGSIILR